MDDSLYFSDQHIAVRDMVREFALEEVAPVASRFDASQEFPWENIQKMSELGLLGIPWPEELGGAGLDTPSYMIAIPEMEALARRNVLESIGSVPVERDEMKQLSAGARF